MNTRDRQVNARARVVSLRVYTHLRVAEVNRCLPCSYIIHTGWGPDTVNRLRLLSAVHGEDTRKARGFVLFSQFLTPRFQVTPETILSQGGVTFCEENFTRYYISPAMLSDVC